MAEMILKSIRRIPVWTYPGGQDAYWDIARAEGRENLIARHNLWRQLWHYLGGFALGWIVPVWFILVVFTAQEIWEVYRNQKFYIKNLIDVCAWTLGGITAWYLYTSYEEMIEIYKGYRGIQ